MASTDPRQPYQAKARRAAPTVMAISAFLGACAGLPSASPAPVVGHEVECAVAPAAALLGRPFSPEIGRRALELSGSEILRVLRPGDGATSDYQTARVNLVLDASDRIAEIRCG